MSKPTNNHPSRRYRPSDDHPWKRAAFVAAEAVKSNKDGKRDEREWRDSVVHFRDRMGVRA